MKLHAGQIGVIAAIATTLVLSLDGLAFADPGTAQIGPGPSDNADGVRCIQIALHVDVDGQYGDLTYRAVEEFQRSHGLSVDGAVGPLTGDKLLPAAPDGCTAHVPSSHQGQDWVPTPQPGAKVSQAELRAEADQLLSMTYMDFIKAKADPGRDANLNWNSDGCSGPEAGKAIYADLFNKPCQQHDFGYGNYGNHSPGDNALNPTESMRKKIDDNFLAEMKRKCDESFGGIRKVPNKAACYEEAGLMYVAVRNNGQSHFSK